MCDLGITRRYDKSSAYFTERVQLFIQRKTKFAGKIQVTPGGGGGGGLMHGPIEICSTRFSRWGV